MINSLGRSRSKRVAACISRLPPCNAICPVGSNIQKWISLAKEERFQEAWEVIVARNPFPAIHGRICYHYCETRCNRAQHDATVSIHNIERFLGDLALQEGWMPTVTPPASGKKILVVGAGPAGLSAAYHLRRLGHAVTIYERLAQPGGTMWVGIPSYRLPREILFGEIERVLALGVTIHYQHPVQDLVLEQKRGKFDAVFLAVGARLGKNLVIATDGTGITMDAVDYLYRVTLGEIPAVGKRLVIYGGGNTAVDVARTAKRLGVPEVTLVYHRNREKMSAFEHEINEAQEEGVKLVFLRSITEFKDRCLTLSVNELDEYGRPKGSGYFEQLAADTLIFAISQLPDTDFLRTVPGLEVQPNGTVGVDNFLMTGALGIFAGGDMTPHERSVTMAVGHGRRAAVCIDSYLHDGASEDANPSFADRCSLTGSPLANEKASQFDIVSFDKLHIDEVPTPGIKEPILSVEERSNSFAEVAQGLSQAEILTETHRCFSCGNCIGCGKCYAECPVAAIEYRQEDGRVSGIKQDLCIGCGKCVRVCPCGTMVMVDR